MKSELKIAVLFTYLFLIVASFGVVAHDIADISRINNESIQTELIRESSFLVSIQNQNHNPLSSLPFSEQLDIELEPEEELGKDSINHMILKNNTYCFYHLKSPPARIHSNSDQFISQNPIYILLEVFRL